MHATYVSREDTTDHILMQCSYSRQVWHRCFCATHAEVEVPIPTDVDNLGD